ncbi:MAG: hypothetical protein ACOCPZ_00335 [Natrialbaceae archaeon]
MICRIGDVVRRGEAVSVAQDVDPGALLDAIRTQDAGPGTADPRRPWERVTVDCAAVGPLHEHVGYIHPEMGLRTRTALAKAGRTRGIETPYDDEIASVRADLHSLSVPAGPDPDERATLAAERATVRSLQEEVAAARGRLQVRREQGLETAAAAAELEAAIRELSEHETAAVAADERTESRTQARERRDALERRLRLEDRIANLEREARRCLVAELREEFAATLDRVPGATAPDDPFSAPPPVAALAIVRLAALDAPVVLSTDRFDSAGAAHEFLGVPVVEV